MINYTTGESEGQGDLQINKKEIKRLIALYKDAKSRGDKSFVFQEKEILVNYAKYLIEYLEEEYS